MKNNLFLVLALVYSLLVAISGCTNDEEMTIVENEDPFVGTYLFSLNHISGLHDNYDSIGNFLGFTVDTNFIDNIEIEIKSYKSDTLLVDGLLSGWNNTPITDLPVSVSENQLTIDFDEGDISSNNYIRGELIQRSDTLFLDYRWDTSDIWSTDATPVYGEHSGFGIKL